MVVVVLLLAGLSFMLSASAGLGGSLILVPGLCLLLDAKQGVALASMLLTLNNVFKLVVYRHSIPLSKAAWILAATVLGAAIGARFLVEAPAEWVSAAVIVCIASSFLFERTTLEKVRRGSSPVLAFAAGASSGFSGTSGPLKGIALRNLGLDRLHFVGAASVVSFAGDAVKTSIYIEARLLDSSAVWIVLAAVPMMPIAALAGRRLNRAIGERAFAALFWLVMAGYVARLAW
jgi:hypothetical protein